MIDIAISLSSVQRIIETRFDFLDVDKIYFLQTYDYTKTLGDRYEDRKN